MSSAAACPIHESRWRGGREGRERGSGWWRWSGSHVRVVRLKKSLGWTHFVLAGGGCIRICNDDEKVPLWRAYFLCLSTTPCLFSRHRRQQAAPHVDTHGICGWHLQLCKFGIEAAFCAEPADRCVKKGVRKPDPDPLSKYKKRRTEIEG